MLPKHSPLSLQEYLEWESKTPLRHEFVDGEIFAMSGSSRRHNLIVTNFVSHAHRAAARHLTCQVFASAMKVYVEARNSIYYPDVAGCCDPSDREDLYLIKPCFIVEVLSPSTASIDRREKRSAYETLPSLEDYIIVDQNRMLVNVYKRHGERWTPHVFQMPSDVVEISCLELRLTVQQIYDGVELPPLRVSEPEPPVYVTAINE